MPLGFPETLGNFKGSVNWLPIQPEIFHDCSAADGATGKLSITFYLDFPNNRLNVDLGKAPGVANIESIGACVKHEFGGVSLGAMDHDHPKYAVSYTATLTAPDAASASTGTPSVGTPSGASSVAMDAPTSSVVWEVAIVRDAPKSGQVIGRLHRGTKVRVGQGQDNWYRVRYGGGFASEGWVYRGSIGK